MKLALCAGLLAFAGMANGQTVLYDTFNESDQANLFDCCNFVQVGGVGGRRTRYQVWVPFTVPVKGKITEIDLPLFYSYGPSNFLVLLHGEHQLKHSFKFQDAPPGHQCCVFVSLTASGIPVAPGVTYQLEVRGLNETQGGWDLNTTGATGDYNVVYDLHGHPQNGILPAMRIIGR